MYQSTEQRYRSEPNFHWEVTPIHSNTHEGDLHGVLFLDVDGTLTLPGSMYAIDGRALDTVAQFIYRGGTCVFDTGATLGRLERTVFNPLFCRLDGLTSLETAQRMFQKKDIAAPENGSAICLNTDVTIVENELNFRWQVLHALDVPMKPELRKIVLDELVPLFENSIVVGDAPGDENPRQYILSWKGITDTLAQVEMIREKIIPRHPEIDWSRISMKAARKTIDFVHADSGKKKSTEWMLRELESLEGPMLGFGDLGDEFAQVVPTINVNGTKPNEFRKRGMPAMELTRWELLHRNGYAILGEGKNAVVRDKKTDKEISVLRNEGSEIIYANQSENGYMVPSSERKGYPVKIRSVGGDAGEGTAWMLQELMDRGYFSKKHKQSWSLGKLPETPVETEKKQEGPTIKYRIGWENGDPVQACRSQIIEIPPDADPLEAAKAFLNNLEAGSSYVIESIDLVLPKRDYPILDSFSAVPPKKS